MAGFELYAPRAANHRRTWTWAVIVMGFVIMTVAQIIVFIPTIIDVSRQVQAHPGVKPVAHVTLQQMAIADGVMTALILLWVWLVEKRAPATIGFNGKPLVRFVRGWLIGAGFLATVVCSLWGLGVYTVEGPGVWQAPTLALILPILGWVLLYIVQGSSEEVWMRGWLMQIVTSRHGVVWGVIINSVIFGALHLFNIKPSPELWAGGANVALFGVFISLYATHERSLWGVCGYHAAWNWLLGVGFGLEVSGIHMDVKPLVIDLKDAAAAPWWLSGGSWGPEASVVTTAVLLIGIAYLLARKALTPGESYAAPTIDAVAQTKN